MEIILTIFFILISLITCIILVLCNELKYGLRKEDENERDNNKSFKS